MKPYEELLANAYATLPEKSASTGERFEMPKFEYFTEGTKTIIKNFTVVCEKIRRDPEFVSKFFSKEFAVPVAAQAERLIIQRKLMGDALNKKLEEFVVRFVICKECKRPDTKIEELKHGLKQMICEACGARTPVR